MQLNAQIQESLALIKDDEPMLRRVANYLKRITKKKEDPTLMTEEEFFARVDKALAQHERGEGVVLNSHEEIDQFFNQLRVDALQN